MDICLLLQQRSSTIYKIIKQRKFIRGTLISFDSQSSYTLIEDGVVAVEDGRIVKVGQFSQFNFSEQDFQNLDDHSGKIIMPGFIDTHVHYPQLQIMGSFGQELLQWLQKYTFPAQRKFSDKQYAKKIAQVFLKELRKNGTTTCMTFATVFKNSVDAFFEQAQKINMQVIAGKVMMDRNCPDFLQDTPETGYSDSLELIHKWHGKGRNHYAVTPRFAPTSSRQQLHMCEKLMKSADNLYLQTHANQNQNEVKWVEELFPEHESYMDVYNYYGLVTKRSVFAHCIHFSETDFMMLKQKEAAVSHCPDSNMFLGSGFYKLQNAKKYGIRTSIGSDIGAGTTPSLLKVLAESYKMHKLNKYTMSSVQGFYMITLGGAKALHLDDHLGKIQQGFYADLVVLDPKGSQILGAKDMRTIEEKLFGLMMLGDDRVVSRTYIAGK